MSTKPDYNIVAEEAIRAGNVPAVLEIDSKRGVIYIHDASKGITAIRICGLPKGITTPIDMTVQPDGIAVTGTYTVEVKKGPLV
jgi:hypothetical protein